MNTTDQITSNNLQRVFLGLGQPPLSSAVDWLADHFRTDSALGMTLDLSNVLLVLPTARSRQQLLQLLVNKSEQQSLLFQPPRIMTLGALPEYLYVADKPLASELTQHIAWVRALEATPADELTPLLGDRSALDVQDFQSLATVIAKLHIRLANDIWSFNSVWREVTADKKFPVAEAKRWETLKAIQKRYYTLLGDVDLWDRYGARNYAAAGLLKANEIRCATDHEIVLVGCADLNRSASEMLRQVAADESSAPLTDRPKVVALVAADDAMADRFDAFGSLVTEQWIDATLPIDDSKLLIVDRPADQAFAIAHYLGNLAADQSGPISTDQVTIGLPDETLAPLVERSLRSIGLASRQLAGVPISRTGPVRLLLAIADYLSGQQFDAFAALLRHPDLFEWLSTNLESDSWLHDLDVYQNRHLPGSINLDAQQPFGKPDLIAAKVDPKDAKSAGRAERNASSVQTLNSVHERLRDWLQPVAGESKAINQWASAWSDVLMTIYGERSIDPDDPADAMTLATCESLLDLLSQQDDVPEEFGLQTSAVQGLNWLLESAASRRIQLPAQPEAIELAGWLDLPLDDAKILVVSNLNEGQVPASEVGHQFLPNHLCEQLRVLDNNRRYARDAYGLTVISSVRDHLLLITGRRDEQGEPLKPSRLLFADTPEVAARRARAFFSYQGESNMTHWLALNSSQPTEQQFSIPQPADIKTIDNLTVTSFKEYLKCPYRFYLGKILRLETLSDDLRELDAGAFGDLCHNVLEAFAQDAVHDSTNADAIFEFLSGELDRQASQGSIGYRLPAVRIQIEQLRQRFKAYAPAQAAHRADGWRIVSTEELLEHPMDVDGQPFTIRGKIDRVDRHEETGQVAVWDYKTSEKGAKPRQTHYLPRKQQWKDLQLPLYRHLVKEVPEASGADFDDLITGYILLHGKTEDIGFHAAEWTCEELASAEETFRSVVRGLRNKVFWPPTDPPPDYSEDFAAICQDKVFEQFTLDSRGAADARNANASEVSS